MVSFNINQGGNTVASPSILNSGSSDRFGFDVGTFSVAETVPAGWSLSGAVCTGAANNGSFAGSTISNIQLAPGNDIVCTFTNNQNNPTLHIDKTKLTSSYDSANDILGYSYVVTNTGNTVISNIAVTDDKINTVTCNPLSLNPGQQSTCSAQYTTKQSDVDNCSVTTLLLQEHLVELLLLIQIRKWLVQFQPQ